MNIKLFALSLGVIGAIARTNINAQVGNVELTIKVMDDSGQPLSGIPVMLGTSKSKGDLVITNAHQLTMANLKASTGVDGQATLNESLVYDGHANYGAPPVKGYYYTTGSNIFLRAIVDGKWQPWNPEVEMILRPIVEPVPMYAKYLELKIPESGKKYGFDFLAGDWVQPNGKGTNSQMYVEIINSYTSFRDYDLTFTLSFPDPHDGIQQFQGYDHSEFFSPRQAPADGYLNSLKLHKVKKAGVDLTEALNRKNLNASYFLQVGTKTNQNGEIISAFYGKIYHGIVFDGSTSNASWYMQPYYINPVSNSRNMEFDPKRNLNHETSDLRTIRP